MNKTQTPCIKCSGTGIVTRFLDYEGGTCFDCNGTGTVTTAHRPRRGSNPLATARQMAANPGAHTADDLAAAWNLLNDHTGLTGSRTTADAARAIRAELDRRVDA
jgi:hypothetical protein